MRRSIFAPAVLIAALAGAPALADPATHTLSLSSKDTVGDRGPDGTNPVCVLKGELRNLQTGASPPISVRFWHPHPGVDDLTSATLEFGSIAPGDRARADWYVNGIRCRDIRVRRTEAQFRASGLPLVKIKAAALRRPRIPAQTLFAERDPLTPP